MANLSHPSYTRQNNKKSDRIITADQQGVLCPSSFNQFDFETNCDF